MGFTVLRTNIVVDVICSYSTDEKILIFLTTSSFIEIFVPGSLLQVPLHSKDYRQGES